LPEGRPTPRCLSPEAAGLLQGHADLHALSTLAGAQGIKLYLAGGAVRDLLLGRPVCDIDLVCDDPLTFARRFAHERSLPFVMLDEERGVARVVAPGLDLDFSAYRAAGRASGRGGASALEADLMERDFTVNAMAVPLEAVMTGRLSPLIDPAGGEADLRAGLLRMVLPRSLADDPLRALRLYRLAAQYRFEIDPATREAAHAQAPRLGQVAGERLRAEIVRLLAVPCLPELRDMAEAGDGGSLLGAIIPGVDDMRGVAQRGYHHLDVFGHALATVEGMEAALASPGDYFPCLEELAPYLAEAPLWLLKLAALLHDAGKPETAAPEGDHVSFHRHEESGEAIAESCTARLRFSRNEAQRLTRLVALHMRPFHLVRLLRLNELTERGVRRMIDAAGDDFPGLFLLAMADSLAASGPLKPTDAEALLADLFCRSARFLRDKLRPLRERPRLLSGHDLMAAFGLPPGPRVGELLEAVEDAALEGAVSSREEALALIAALLKD